MPRHATFEDGSQAINGSAWRTILQKAPRDPYRPSASRSWVLSGADAVAAAELAGEPGFEGLGGGGLGGVGIAEAAPGRSDAPPLADQRTLAEQGRLDRQDVVAGHVPAVVAPFEHEQLECRIGAGSGALHAPIFMRVGGVSNDIVESVDQDRFVVAMDEFPVRRETGKE
jgi:hypothetical protein